MVFIDLFCELGRTYSSMYNSTELTSSVYLRSGVYFEHHITVVTLLYLSRNGALHEDTCLLV